MLARHRHSFLALTLILPALYGGCVVTTEDTDNDVDQATGSGVSTSSSTGGGDGGEGGQGGDGGDGGEGGQGGDGGDGGEGGQGGTGACVEAEDAAVTVADCDDLNIAPAQGATSQCGDTRDQVPFGYAVCKRAFAIYAESHVEDLLDCLSDIGVERACDDPPVNACVKRMYDNACTGQSVGDCDVIASSCGTDPFDAATCAAQLNPISEAGFTELVECMNDNLDVTCQQAYDGCLVEVISVE
ncbi:hypothetical protein [Sorangium sp. So ce362]|uniref:hypothetical protein n=1 Tax=Sorangium sp. So ce362 TaxID=3133303 RepID=UPI003F5D7A7A